MPEIGGQPYAPWQSVFARHIAGDKIDEYYEAKGTLIWIPLIKKVVLDASGCGVINREHIPLFENILFGLIAIETCGRFAQTGNFGNTPYQKTIGSFRGLGQMVAEKHYLEENPYDPLTAIRISLRNTAFFIYKAGNVESALAEHNNGKIGTMRSRVGIDAFATIGQEFVMRVVNAAWWGHFLSANRDSYTGIENYQYQWKKNHPNAQYYKYAPPWNFIRLNNKSELEISEPDLLFNWIPPETSKAYETLAAAPGTTFMDKMRNLIESPIEKNVWADPVIFRCPVRMNQGNDENLSVTDKIPILLDGIEIPGWFYTYSIAPAVPPQQLRPLAEKDREVFPCGIKGKTPAYFEKRHNFFLEDSDLLKDRIGRNREGRWYCYSRDVFESYDC